METHKLYICNKIVKQVNCPESVCIYFLLTVHSNRDKCVFISVMCAVSVKTI